MATTTSRARRSPEEWDELARELLPELQAGHVDLRDRIGSNADALKTALARLGYDSRGEPLAIKEVTAASEKTLAKRVAQRRREKAPWWMIKAETGKSYTYLIGILTENGFATDGTSTGNGTA